jgi:hypothetical protein
LDTKESKLESGLHGLQRDLHDTTFLVWTSRGLAMELHPSNLEAHKQNGLIGQGTKNKD